MLSLRGGRLRPSVGPLFLKNTPFFSTRKSRVLLHSRLNDLPTFAGAARGVLRVRGSSPGLRVCLGVLLSSWVFAHRVVAPQPTPPPQMAPPPESEPYASLDDHYLSSLLSYSVTQLNGEPQRLEDAQRAAQRTRITTAQSKYDAFVGASQCYDIVRKEVADVEKGLEDLRKSLPALREGCQEFAVRAEQISSKRVHHRRTLANQSTLLDLLEAPSLQDTCVRHGNYDEALEIESFLEKANSVNGERVSVIHELHKGSRDASDVMLTQLLEKLRGHITLPECLRVIGVLRRAASMDENSLRRVFLRSRERHLRETLGQQHDANQDPYDHVKKVTDTHRVFVFDVVTQFRAIFSNEEDDEEEPGGADTYDADEDGEKDERRKVLPSWCAHRTSEYVHTLAQYVPSIDEGSRLAAAYEHSRYCSLSLARVGCDHRGLILPVFTKSAINLFKKSIASTVHDFEKQLTTHRWSTLGGSSGKLGGNVDSSESLGDTANVYPEKTNENKSLPPPKALVEHVPVAAFTNGVLQSLNEIRHCVFAFADVRGEAATVLSNALCSVSVVLVQVEKQFDLKDNTSKRSAYVGACKALTDVAVPYLVNCFGKVFKGGERDIDVRKAVEPLTKAMLSG